MVQQGYSIFLPYRMAAAGIPTGQFTLASLGYRPYDVLFTTDDMIAKHPDLVRKTLAAVKQGWADFTADPFKTRDLILKMNPLVPLEVHNKAVGEMIADLLPHDTMKIGCMVPARWQELTSQLQTVRFLPPGFDPATAYDGSFVAGC